MIRKYDKKNRFMSMFDPKTGFYARTGILDENGKDTGVDPFMTSFPELIDLGVMQKCFCSQKCNVDCYQKAIDRTGNNMSLENIEKILKQCEKKMFQCLYEKEIVLKQTMDGNIKSIYIKDVRPGDKIYCGNNQFFEVSEKLEKIDEVYEIILSYGKRIIATADHKFPTLNGLKKVCELNIGDKLKNIKENLELFKIEEIDVVKKIIELEQDDKFYLTDCSGLKELCKELNIIRNNNKTVKLSLIKDHLDKIDYSTAYISKERSQYQFSTKYKMTEDLMALLGHYIGNGSKRTYTISKEQTKMIETIEKALKKHFPSFNYTKQIKENTCKIELNSTILHELLFDEIFECRTISKEKQLPNFIYNIDNKFKLAFLKGYFCDGSFAIKTHDGNYGNITLNTSSEKLYKDLGILLTTMNVDYSVQIEEGKQEIFSKKEKRVINRKRRYKLVINNLNEIIKVIDIVKDHKNFKDFYNIVLKEHDEKYLRERKDYEIKEIKKLNKKQRVIDININSDEHLFVTSNGIISHNCALGGAGDVDTHENFEEILKLFKKYNIVPNFTTSGIAMTAEKASLCKEYCGAVAVSEHFADYTENALNMLIDAGVKTSIHYVLSTKTIDTAIERLKNDNFKKGINAVVFLLYKPVGLGKEEFVLKPEDPRVSEFFELIDKGNFHHKIGFDSCTSSGIVNFSKETDLNSIDFCEGARFSAYIDANMNMMPCSFANQNPNWHMNLNDYTIEEIWNSELFDKFRNSLKNSCSSCANRANCGGGCPLVNQITLCNRKERHFYENKV